MICNRLQIDVSQATKFQCQKNVLFLEHKNVNFTSSKVMISK